MEILPLPLIQEVTGESICLYVHLVLVNRLGGLCLPRNGVSDRRCHCHGYMATILSLRRKTKATNQNLTLFDKTVSVKTYKKRPF